MTGKGSDALAAMDILILTLDGVFDTGLATLLDTFTIANDLSDEDPLASRVLFRVKLVGMRKQVKTGQGLPVSVESAKAASRPDIVIVPALGAKTPATLQMALRRNDVVEAGHLLRQWAADGVLIGAACTSSFVLAEAQLLNGLPATTSWWLAPMFRERYPLVKLDESRMLVESAQIIVAGAALAHLDLALCLIRRASPTLAALTARYLLFDHRPSQAAFIIPYHLVHSDPVVERFENWVRQNLTGKFSLKAAALASQASERTLSRRLNAVLGKSPLSYFQDVRVERATHLLQTTRDSIEQIASQVGYSDGVTLRALLKRRIGRSARELRTLKPSSTRSKI